jgi:hypothetical protein
MFFVFNESGIGGVITTFFSNRGKRKVYGEREVRATPSVAILLKTKQHQSSPNLIDHPVDLR